MKYSQTLFDDKYKNSTIASPKELGSISGYINLNHTGYTHLSATNKLHQKLTTAL